MMMVQSIRIRMVMVTFNLLTNLAIAAPRKMSGWDFPRRQTETTERPQLFLLPPGTLNLLIFFNFFKYWRGPFFGCTWYCGRLGRDDDTSFCSPPASSCWSRPRVEITVCDRLKRRADLGDLCLGRFLRTEIALP